MPKLQNKIKKIAILPIEIAGYVAGLVNGFDAIGVKVWQIELSAHKFEYDTKPLPLGLKFLIRTIRRLEALPYALKVCTELPLRLLLVLIIACRCDAIVCIFGKTLLPKNIDLWIYKLFRRKTCMVYLGSDSRPEYLNVRDLIQSKMNYENLGKLIAKKKRRLTQIQSKVDFVVDNPMSWILHNGSVTNWFSLGFPVVIDEINTPIAHLEKSNNKVKILHCPSNRLIKGSDEITIVIKELIQEGYPVELIELTDVTRKEVIQHLLKVDLAIDQLYSDTPLAGFATECATVGVPVIVGSLAVDSLKNHFFKIGLDVPSILINPSDLKLTLIDLLQNRNKLKEASDRATRFVRKEWSPSLVASRFISLWSEGGELFNVIPAEVSDATGIGLSEKNLNENLSKYYLVNGESGFHINTTTNAYKHLIDRAQL